MSEKSKNVVIKADAAATVGGKRVMGLQESASSSSFGIPGILGVTSSATSSTSTSTLELTMESEQKLKADVQGGVFVVEGPRTCASYRGESSSTTTSSTREVRVGPGGGDGDEDDGENADAGTTTLDLPGEYMVDAVVAPQMDAYAQHSKGAMGSSVDSAVTTHIQGMRLPKEPGYLGNPPEPMDSVCGSGEHDFSSMCPDHLVCDGIYTLSARATESILADTFHSSSTSTSSNYVVYRSSSTKSNLQSTLRVMVTTKAASWYVASIRTMCKKCFAALSPATPALTPESFAAMVQDQTSLVLSLSADE